MTEKVSERYWVVIPAAGIGQRMQTEIPKQYLKIQDKTILEHSINVFLDNGLFEKIIVVLNSDDSYFSKLLFKNAEKIQTTIGGQHRVDSVYQGLLALNGQAASNDWVLVHDAARPFLSQTALNRLIETLSNHDVGGLLAMPVTDTVKKTDVQGDVIETVPRENLWLAQTPQMFRYGLLKDAIEYALSKKMAITDEASAISFFGKNPRLVEGDSRNIKITRPEDLL